VVGIGLARDIARKVDAGAFADLDAFAEAISLAETVGATETSFVTSPATALTLAKVKTGTGSNARCSVRTPPQRPSRFAGRPHAAATPPRRLAALGRRRPADIAAPPLATANR
jgi:hypothetical protein